MNGNFFRENGEKLLERTYRVRTVSPIFIPNVSLYDNFEIVNLGATLKIENPSGQAYNGQIISIAIRATSVRTVSWGTRYGGGQNGEATLSTSLNAGKNYVFNLMWMATEQKWFNLCTAIEG